MSNLYFLIMKYVLLGLGIISCILWYFPDDEVTMDSPSNQLSVTVENVVDSVSFKILLGNDEISSLDMGIKLADKDLFFSSIESIGIQKVGGENKYNEYILSQKEGDIIVRLRLYDDAVAFRYEGKNRLPSVIKEECSAWRLPAETTIWYFERKNAWKLKSYAGTWEHTTMNRLANVASSAIQGTPVVFQHPSGYYGFITEAGLEDYSGLRLEVIADNAFKANFTEAKKGFQVSPRFKSPWRIFFVGKDLNALVNQDIIKNIVPEPDEKLYADRSYIQPGKCAWRWFAKGTGCPAQERLVIDEAAQMSFLYSLVDDGWKNWTNCWEEAEQLVSYAKSKGIRLLFWQHSEPLRNPDNNYEAMRNFLDSIAHIGAAGVKVDFMDSEAKPLIDFEIKLLQECAKRRLIVNFHGCQAPSGEAYTYPNELTREGIRGMELNKMREGYIPAYHNAALPFTRLMVGHGDYTPLSFTVPGTTTFAHQLATLICFDSPLQTIAEDPGLLFNEPLVNKVANFIREVPTVWDEVRVLPQSAIGKLAVLAKRKGKNWYIGVLNGESVEKSIKIDFSEFLSPTAGVVAYLDDLTADKILLSMEGHRKGLLRREASVPFKVINDLESLSEISLAPEGGAVVVIH